MTTDAEVEIRSLLEDWADAIRAKDVSRAVAYYAKGNVQFIFFAARLQFSGENELGEEVVQKWFSQFEGPVGYELRDLKVFAGAGIAFCHFLNRLTATPKDGAGIDLWLRVTLGFQKIGGLWKIVHAHESVPIKMDDDFKGAVDLKP